MQFKHVFAILSALLTAFPLAFSGELLTNGTFAGAAKSANPPAPWQTENPAGITWDTDGTPTLRLEVSDRNPAPTVRQEITLPHPLPSALRVEADVKLENIQRGEKSWHSGRILVTYLDAGHDVLGDTFTLDRLQGDSPWKTVRRQFPVPAGAARVRLELQLLQAKTGRISFRNVSLQALSAGEADQWRTAAEDRIRQHRMAPLQIRVVDESGRPVSGAEVAVFQRRHAYPFGTAVKPKLLLAEPGDPHADTYRAVVECFFNYATLENELKAPRVEKNGLDEPLRALAWLNQRGIARRGHVLTWPSYEMSARAVVASKDDPDKVRALMKAHFHDVLAATAPLGIVDWDVVNEPAVHTDLIRLLGDDQVAEWFRWAREGAPQARLFLNENNVEFQGGNRENLEGWLTRLRKAGAPLGGIGWQGHMWHRTLPSGQNILDDLDHFAPYGLPVQLTEYDTDERFSDEDEARFLEEFLTAWFSHPLTDGFIMWGFQDAYIWNRNAPLFRSDWTLKPSGKIWMDLVFGKWWTEESGRTAGDGLFATRAFLGTYDVEVRSGGRRVVRRIDLPREGMQIEIPLDARAEADDPAARLASSNPYRTGKLPPRVEPEQSNDRLSVRRVGLKEGRGAWAFLGPEEKADAALLGKLPSGKARVLYLRFDPQDLGPGSVAHAVLEFELGSVAKPPRLEVYALSHRFVRVGEEAGRDWTVSDIVPGRAPGRDGDAFRIGDAGVIYLGEATVGDGESGRVRFSSSSLAQAVRDSAGRGLTVIVTSSDPAVEVKGLDGSTDGPRLEWTTRKAP
jgi:GH35 family endo-1,4-beta-xylanase